MAIFAAVDIGSNSVRLKISRVVRHRLRTLHEDREVTRLGQSVFQHGVLSPDAMHLTVKVLRRFRRATVQFHADRVRVVGTSALREARNGPAFKSWVQAETGWNVEVISGLEEGRLIRLGILANSRTIRSRMLLMDLGGGSCELMVSETNRIRDIVSLPIGAVRLTQEFLAHDPPTHKELNRMRSVIAEEIDAIARRVVSAKVGLMIATSGTAAAIATAAGGYVFTSQTKSGSISRRATIKLAEELSRMNIRERAKVPGIGVRRAEIIVAGSIVFAELMKRCDVSRFQYSPLGLRDGILAQMLAEEDRSIISRRQIDSERETAVLNLCKQYGTDLKMARCMHETVMALFLALRRVHGLGPNYETYLAAAAMLHDVGSIINRSGRQRHTYYLIRNSEIFGFSPYQRHIIAAIAACVGKAKPQPGDQYLKDLNREDELLVLRAVAILRLAKAVNQWHPGKISGIRVSNDKHKVLLRLKTTGEADLELWAIQKEKLYFREVFGRVLEPVLS